MRKVNATIADVLAGSAPIHGLVNNAGGQFMAPLKDISLNGWEAVVKTNLTGGFLMARECYRASMEAHGGAIVNIIADMWHSMPGMGHSGAARAGMLNFTQTAAVEWASSGVRVNAVCPSLMVSEMTKDMVKNKKLVAKFMERMPLGRVAQPADIAAVIAFLASDDARFITGTNIPVDGGVTAT